MPSRTGCASLLLPTMLCAFALCGCSGVTQNPSYFPSLLPFGDIVRTHAKPPGASYFSNFDPHAVKLVVRPVESCSPARQQHVLIATVYDEKGQPRRHRRVEWMVEGAGNIVEVDESGYFPGRGYKVDNKYAVSYTDYFEHRITRGNTNPNDDFVIRPGQSWCVITSAAEGDTHVTVYAPEISNWQDSRVYVTHHWIDAQWTPPVAAAQPCGTEHVFTTNLFRPSDNRPLPNYRVRYRILDGPPAVLLPSRSQEFASLSDLRGNASVAIAQLTPGAGSNRIAVEVIPATDPASPSAPGIIIGRLETRVDWLAPAVSLNLEGPPTATVGDEARYTIAVNNTGRLESKALTVRYAVPRGLQVVRSEPPALVDGEELVWTLGTLPAAGTRSLQVVLRTTREEQANGRVTVKTEEGLRDERTITTLVTRPGLKVAMNGPPNGAVGVPVTYQLTVNNPGTGAVDHVVLEAKFDEGLEAEVKANPIRLRLDTPLGPGQARTVPLTLTPRRPGKLNVQVTASAGKLTEQAASAVEVRDASVKLSLVGPKDCFAGRTGTWDLTVTNPGQVPLANGVLRDLLPPELQFVSATEGGQVEGSGVVWNIGLLQPGITRTFKVTANCVRVAPAAVQHAVVSGEPSLSSGGEAPAAPSGGTVRAEAEAKVEVRGLSAFRLNVAGRNGPVEVGNPAVYTIEVTNQGTLPGNQVQVTATVPEQMRFVAAGPGEYRVDGQKVTFAPRDGLEPGQTWTFTVSVMTLKVGDARFQAELRSATLREPVVVQQSTTVFGPATERRPPVPTTP
jgi:uncharacterized repeat protein (TIGR01451 family)